MDWDWGDAFRLRGHRSSIKDVGETEKGSRRTRSRSGHGVTGKAKVDVHIWFKIYVFKFNCSITLRITIRTPKSINGHISKLCSRYGVTFFHDFLPINTFL